MKPAVLAKTQKQYEVISVEGWVSQGDEKPCSEP